MADDGGAEGTIRAREEDKAKDGEGEGGAKRQRVEGEAEGGEEEYYAEEGYDEAGYDEAAGEGEGEYYEEGAEGAEAAAELPAEEQAAPPAEQAEEAGEQEEDVKLEEEEAEGGGDGGEEAEGAGEAAAGGTAALMGGDFEDDDDDEDGDGDWEGGGYGFYPPQPTGPTWICRNCTTDDNAEEDLICEDGCQEPRAHSLCEDPATRIAQVLISAEQKAKEARRFHLRMAIGYDERMCAHRAVKPTNRTVSAEGDLEELEKACPHIDPSATPPREDAEDGEGGDLDEARSTEPGAGDAAAETEESQEAAAPEEAAATEEAGAEEAAEGAEGAELREATEAEAAEAEAAQESAADATVEGADDDAAAAAAEDGSAEAAASDAAEESRPFEFDGFTCNHTREFITGADRCIIKKDDDNYHTFTHPERPDRLKCVYEHLKSAGLLENTTEISGREATGFELSTAHDAEHVGKIGDIEGQRGTIDGDTYFVEESSLASRLAVGVTCDVMTSIVKGESDNGIALVRPPGHHAEGDKAMGFCLFNNVACGIRTVQQELGVERVLIVDWDVHHGNGTENIFYDDPSVLMLSIHRADAGFYPDTGHTHRTGTGDGAGYNVNVAWPKGGMGDADYMLAFHRIVLPIAYDFKPDLVVISAGFDSGLGDPLGGCRITPEGYAHMTHMLMGLAEGKVAVVMEGGYNLRTISRSFAACARVLKGGAPPPLHEPTCRPCSAAMYAVTQTQLTLAEYWPALRMMGMRSAGGMDVGAIPGMSDTSDDGDFDMANGDSGGDGDGPGLAGMLGGESSDAELDEDVLLDEAAATADRPVQQAGGMGVEADDDDIDLDESQEDEAAAAAEVAAAAEEEGLVQQEEAAAGGEEGYEEYEEEYEEGQEGAEGAEFAEEGAGAEGAAEGFEEEQQEEVEEEAGGAALAE